MRRFLFIAKRDFILRFISHCAIMPREGNPVLVRRFSPVAQAHGCDARIDAKLTAFAESGIGDVKALRGAAGMRLRSGDWRVVFTVSGDTITVHAVGHRREIYD